MQASTVVVGRVQHAVDAVAVERSGVVVLHRLEVEQGLGSDSLVGPTTAVAIAEDGAGYVSSVPVRRICFGCTSVIP